jgi:hypothetical protein
VGPRPRGRCQPQIYNIPTSYSTAADDHAYENSKLMGSAIAIASVYVRVKLGNKKKSFDDIYIYIYIYIYFFFFFFFFVCFL